MAASDIFPTSMAPGGLALARAALVSIKERKKQPAANWEMLQSHLRCPVFPMYSKIRVWGNTLLSLIVRSTVRQSRVKDVLVCLREEMDSGCRVYIINLTEAPFSSEKVAGAEVHSCWHVKVCVRHVVERAVIWRAPFHL